MIRFGSLLFLLTLFATSTLGCGGTAAIGEGCDTRGATDDECEEGSICDATSDEGGDTICLEVCVDQDDCGADESCNGVSDSNTKACHPKNADDGKDK